nr:DUF6850 family outer membrane beta-barrel protein [uncultured Allomuricauda sp.]
MPLSQWESVRFEQNALAFDNPMFLEQLDSLDIGRSKLAYFNQHNSFRDAYMPERTYGIAMQAERFISVKNWKVYGNFQFSRYEDLESRFTAMANPYRDNPYIVADSAQADWRKQYYLLEAKIVSPAITHYIKAGLGIKYEVLNGARQKDPRPLDKTLNLELTPSFVFQVNEKWQIGVNGFYNRLREDLNISLQNHLRSQEIYKMLGLGAYLYNGPILLSGGLSRVYEGNTFGGGLALGYSPNPKHHLKSILTYKHHNEKATDGTSTPFKAGEHVFNDVEARISYSINGSQNKHSIMLDALYRTTSDTEFIQTLNTTTQFYEVLYSTEMHSLSKAKVGLDYEMLVPDNKQNVKWLYRFGARLHNLEEEYPSTQSRRSLSNIMGKWGATRWVHLKKGTWSFSYNGRYLTNLDEDFIYYENSTSTNFVAFQIARPNHMYNTTSLLSNQFDIQYTFGQFKKYRAQFYITAGFQNFRAMESNTHHINGMDNNRFTLTIGLYN